MKPHHEHDALTHALMAEKLNRCRPPKASVHPALVDAPWRRAQRGNQNGSRWAAA